ncbi:MAG: CmcJ/NvfI family oxidoreductase, partial [Pseudomonadota bacterium]|nr:CmcJ/NvfI family oxidoreductase [Pseudomonadota bacterium]
VMRAPLKMLTEGEMPSADDIRACFNAIMDGEIGQIQMAHFNPDHDWVYFPAMEEGEVALIKTYDSATDGRTRFTIHTAFSDPLSPEGAMPRQSIETRCFAFF